ncbi:MAG: hypothetical protein M1829_006458 [Trizodia sp. TS-e1964]|nr:MAG: hypothetical protein M1829_006458 [Trizodia sp. TS-e1964]
MSDDDFMQDSEPEEYDFEYEEDDEDDNADVEIENKYYNGKQIKLSSPEEALAEFLSVPALEAEKGTWGFKAIKQAIKLEFKLKLYDKVIEHYSELLTYVKSAVLRNYSEKSINNLLDFVEKGSDQEDAVRCMEAFYSLTLQTFQASNNERLWIKTNIKLARLWLERREYVPLVAKLRDLHSACQDEDGVDDPSKGTYAMELYAIEIQMYSNTSNYKKLKKALQVRSAVPHPRIMGIIRECGGKMHMSEENWNAAQSDFFESFRNYDEAGSMQRIQVLKYLVLTTMLKQSDINPFESQETKPYQNDPRISALTDLVDAYIKEDVEMYERVLQQNQNILEDPFIAENIDEITRNMRIKGVVRLISPYTRFTIEFVRRSLNISVEEVKEILAYLILEERVQGKINEADGTVEIETRSDAERLEAVDGWAQAFRQVWESSLPEHENSRGYEFDFPGGFEYSPVVAGGRMSTPHRGLAQLATEWG